MAGGVPHADVERLLDAGAAAVAAAVNTGEVTAGEVAAAATGRARAAPPHVLLATDPSAVQAQVAVLEERLAAGERPPLAGAPMAHKDLFDTQLFPTTYGNPAFEHRPVRDATAVARLEAAGAIQVATANLHEVAFGVTGLNPHTGDVTNPYDRRRVAGGSSSGSAAAVASGTVVASLGTDTGGSVRIPASCCGVVGVKSTRGAVPTTGVLALSWLQDTVGPVTRTVGDAALLLDAIAGPDGRDPVAGALPAGWSTDLNRVAARVTGRGHEHQHRLAQVTVLLPRPLWEESVAPEVVGPARSAVSRLADAGAGVQEIDLPGFDAARHAQGVLLSAHALTVHREQLVRDPAVFGADVRERLERARRLTATEVVEALRTRDRWRAALAELLSGSRLLACPTLPIPPPYRDQRQVAWPGGSESVTASLTRLTGVWNLAGLPAVSVPASRRGLPCGLQLVGRRWSEPDLLDAAAVATDRPASPP